MSGNMKKKLIFVVIGVVALLVVLEAVEMVQFDKWIGSAMIAAVIVLLLVLQFYSLARTKPVRDATGLDFFADGHFTTAYETLGFYSSADFIELGRAFGVAEDEVREHIAMFAERRDAVEKMLNESALSNEAKARYLFRFHDRLRAIAQ